MKPKFHTTRLLAGSIALFASLTALHAADGTWIATTAGPFNWSDTANWADTNEDTVGDIADGAGFTAFFTSNISANQTVTVDTARTIGNITFTDSTTISNNLTIGPSADPVQTLTLDVPTGLSLINVTQLGRTLTISAPLTVNDGIQQTGPGALTISGATTISGGIQKDAGTAALTFSGPVTLGGAQTWTNNSSVALSTGRNTNLIDSAGFQLTVDGTGSFNFGTINNTEAALTGTGALVKNGSGRLNVGGINTGFSGTITINGGVLQVHNNNEPMGLGNLTINSGVYSFYWGANYTRTLGVGDSQVQILGGESGFAGSGTTGPTINLGSSVRWGAAGEGAVDEEDPGATGYFNPSKFVLGDPGTSNAAATTFSSGINLNGGTRIIVVPPGTSAAGNSATISGAITNSSGTASLIKEGAGRLTVSAASTWNGNLTVSGGHLIFSNNTTTWAGTTTVNGGLLDMGGLNLANIGGGSGRNITVAAGAGIRFNALSNAILNRIVETGDEITVMTGTTSNSFDFSSSTGANLPNAFLGHWAGNGAKMDYSGTITPASDNYRLGSLIFRNGLLGLTNTSPMTGSQGLIVAGRVELVGPKTFSGDTVVRANAKLGLAAITGGGGVSLSLQNSVFDVGSTGGNFWLESNNFSGNPINNAVKTTSAIFGGLKGSRNLRDVYSTTTDVNNGAATPFYEISGFTLNPGTAVSANYTGNIANFARDMTLTKTGEGTQTLGGNNSHSGATTINTGVLAIGHANALGSGGSAGTSSGATIVNSGASLDLNGVSGLVEPIVLNSTGFGGNGALVNNSGTAAGIASGIASLQITSGGTYTTPAPTASISGTGTGATATVQFGLTAASLTSVTGGANWAVGDRFTTTGSNGSEAILEVTEVTAGNPTAWIVVDGGRGFTGAPTGIARLTKNPTGFTAGTFTFNANNFAVTGLALTNAGTGYDNTTTVSFSSGSATAAVQYSGVTLASDSSIGGSGDITVEPGVAESGGSRSLTKVGAGTLTLSGVNTYSGDTTVSGGTLSLGAVNASNESSTVTIGASGVLQLTYAGTDTVDKLFIGSTQQPAGVYGHSTSGANNGGQGVGALDARFASGTGTLTVTSGPGGGPTGFAAWQLANSTTGGLDDDHDNDGVDNGTEYFIYGPVANSGFTALPGVTNTGGTLSITWTKAAGYTGTYGTHFVVETSETLQAPWTSATEGTGPGFVEITGNDVKYTFPAGARNFARLKVTGP